MRLTRSVGPAWDALNERHLSIIGAAVASHEGIVVRTEGDAVFAVFAEAGAAVAAALDAQRALTGEPWPDSARIKVRMGLHSGEAHLAGDDYGGIDVGRAARIAATAHGGQVILSSPTMSLVVDRLPDQVSLRSLGDFVLKDVDRPEALYQLDAPGLPSGFPPLRAGAAVSGNLEERLTSFVGRETDIETIRTLLDERRLVTLTGPGGIGKSSLAVEVARSVQAEYPDGAWFVPLASIDRADAVEPLIARTIGLFDGPYRSAVETLPGFVADRAMLFVFDNFEHVLDAAAVVGGILRASPGSKVVVTSRSPLHVAGEQEWPVGPLVVDGVDEPARRLFDERARAVRPGWDPGPDAAIVGEIVRSLDGLPLGIELAAARVALLPPAAILDRLAARLPLPGADARDAPARQRTLDAAVAWSHDLLSPDLQHGLHRLSVFDETFDLEQAGRVAIDDDIRSADVLDILAELVDRSLLQRAPDQPGVRFRMLRTIRSFAAARLVTEGEELATRRRHALAFLDLAETAKGYEGGKDGAAWLDRLSADDANLRSALTWAIDHHESDIALRLVAALWRFWQADGHLREGRILAGRALAMPTAKTETAERMWAVAAAGSIAYWQGDFEESQRRYDEELAIAEVLGDGVGLADAYFNLGHLVFLNHEDEATLLASEARTRAAFEAIGDERGLARVRWALGNIALGGLRPEEAIQTLQEALGAFEALGDAQYHAMTMASMSWAHFTLGDIPAACRYAVRSLVETFAMRDRGTTTISLHVGVLMADMLGRFEDAARLTGAFDALCERYGVRPPAALGRFIDTQDPFGAARQGLGSDEAWERLYAEGGRMDLEGAVALIVELGSGFNEPAGVGSADASTAT